MKLVCIGDSLTYGYGVLSAECWVDLIKMHFDIEVINQGVNGDTTSGILSRYYSDVIDKKPDYVIIMAGTNDLLMNYPLTLIKDNIKILVKEAKENTIVPIIAFQPPIIAEIAESYWNEKGNYATSAIILAAYVNWLKTYSQDNNIDFVNFYDIFINENSIKSLYSDGIHPNADGHKLMFDAVFEVLRKKFDY